MKLQAPEHLKSTHRLLLNSIVEWLLFLPVWIVLQKYLQSGVTALPWMYTLPLISMAGVMLRQSCNRKWKQLLAALLLGVLAGILAGAFSLREIPLYAGAIISAYLGITAGGRSSRLRIYTAGIAVYFVATIAFARIPLLQPSVAVLTWSGSLCLILALLDSNTSHLHYSSFTGDGSPLPRGIRRHNRLFVLLFIAVAALLAAGAGRALGLFLWHAAQAFFGWVSRLFSDSSKPEPQQEAPPQVMPEMPPAETHEPGLLAMILNAAFYAIGAAALIVILYFGLRWLYRNSGGVWRKFIDSLLSLLRRESPQNNTAYQDEEKSIFTWEKTVQGVREYWRSRTTSASRRDRWEGMNGGREQTRWLYRHWLKNKRAQGYLQRSYLTPQETTVDIAEWNESRKPQRKAQETAPDASSAQLLRFYNQARYGGTEPSEAEVRQLKERLKL
ncbi:hypothetical protein A3844_00715 [Paenibacillus helianthi]|uniref:Protein-glutamine gamma-glutamyltransferase-like C-terminal domain-containing protein n=1 Tax=Paenibacillus helianthi TaxID=1349432 RepID=A0ABX3EU03_9BACL|nr:DUF4129 domain-containing protein [Paenibacillus helianthi]OKP91682.1 hypothetical protein A3844_00715 [Paenibacillus helianthi]